MSRYIYRSVLFVLSVIGVSQILPAQATFSIVSYMYSFGPPIGLVEGSPGIFYSNGGVSQNDAFSITSQGKKTFLAAFPPGVFVQGPLVSAANQRFYSGIAETISSGSVFSVDSAPGKKVYPSQAISPLLTANLPDGALLGDGVGPAALFYLVTADPGTGAVTTVYSFPSGERLPHAAIYASDGNYYGVSYLNDASGYVFRVTPSGSLTKIFNFPTLTFIGNPIYQALLQATDGNLYGTTHDGGANGTGTIYKLTLDGQYTLLYSFPKGQNYNPDALIEASDGNLYGATEALNGIPLLFKITKSGQYTTLASMGGLGCVCLITQGSDGIIYGTAIAGGPVGGGAVFALNAGLPKPAPQALKFGPQHGPVGTRVRIWGNNLLAAAVQFGSLPADAVASSGPNYVWATVPAGATTGPITVTTPGGTTTTQAVFTVE